MNSECEQQESNPSCERNHCNKICDCHFGNLKGRWIQGYFDGTFTTSNFDCFEFGFSDRQSEIRGRFNMQLTLAFPKTLESLN